MYVNKLCVESTMDVSVPQRFIPLFGRKGKSAITTVKWLNQIETSGIRAIAAW